MFKIYDGRDKFYQWDLDRKLIVAAAAIKEVHFCNRTDNCSLVCETYVEDGLTLVNVPNVLLQTDWKIHVYAYDGLYTKYDDCFEVVSRTKPADYIYTETEVKRYEDLEERVAMLEASGGGGGSVDFNSSIPIISWDEANELLSTGIYRIDNGSATSILISSLLEQQARQVLITGDEFSSRYKTKNIETNEWGDWSDWNYFTTSEDFQNAINFVNETLANYYTKEEANTLFVASDYYEARMAQTDEKIEANLQ